MNKKSIITAFFDKRSDCVDYPTFRRLPVAFLNYFTPTKRATELGRVRWSFVLWRGDSL